MSFSGFKSYVGHRVREVLLVPDLLQKRSGTSVMFFTAFAKSASGLLRAELISQVLRRQGWRTINIPSQLDLAQRRRLIKWFDPDILFFQTCRHPLNDANHIFGRPFVVDMDDADFFDTALLDRLVRTCPQAAGVIAGSRFVADWCRTQNPNTTVIWTGTPLTPGPRPAHRARPPIVAWAQSAPLLYRLELVFVRDFLRRMIATGTDFRLRLYGITTPQDHARIEEEFAGLTDWLELLPFMEYQDFLRSLDDVAVGLSPVMPDAPYSRGKSFGKILAYLDARVPVIASDEVDHALFFTPESGILSNDVAVWVEGARRLLASPEARDQMAEAAFQRFLSELTTEAAAAKVARFLECL